MPTNTKYTMSRRNVLFGIGAVGAASLGGTLLTFGSANGAGLTEVNMQLGWLASNGILGEVAADKLGYYADLGLALKVTPGGPNVDGVASVASGAANLGSISSSPSLMLARAAGIPVKCIAAGYQKHPYTYFSLKKDPIRTPQDMIGKKIGIQATGKILLLALLAKNKIPEDKVTIVTIGNDMTPLMTGQVDAITGWTTNIAALSVLGDQRVDLSLWDAGIHLYANPYYVSDDTLANKGDLAANMMRASAKGWGWVYKNPDKAVEFLVERYQNLDKKSELAAVSLINGFSFNEATAKGGWGVMTKQNWQDQIDTYAALGQFAGEAPKVDDVMTLSVLEATAADRPTYG